MAVFAASLGYWKTQITMRIEYSGGGHPFLIEKFAIEGCLHLSYYQIYASRAHRQKVVPCHDSTRTPLHDWDHVSRAEGYVLFRPNASSTVQDKNAILE